MRKLKLDSYKILTSREKCKIYESLAEEYLRGEKTMYEICLEYEQEHGWFPTIRSLSSHVSKLKHAK